MKDKLLRQYLGLEEQDWGHFKALTPKEDGTLSIHNDCINALAEYLGVEFVPKNEKVIVRKKSK
jgi:hypothetical protein